MSTDAGGELVHLSPFDLNKSFHLQHQLAYLKKIYFVVYWSNVQIFKLHNYGCSHSIMK